jgi:hypothetical protein
MGERKQIVLLNIEHYKWLLASETDPDERVALSRQPAEQEGKLQEMDGRSAAKAHFSTRASASDRPS